MNVGLAALIFVPGLAAGSFLNVVASRLPVGRSLSKPRSNCPRCAAPIRPRDNIPLLSYVLLRGRCRSCQNPISRRYPVLEFSTAALAVASVLAFGPTLHALTAAIFCAALVTISATDIERRIVPNRVVLPATAVILVLQLVRQPSPEWPAAGLGAAMFLFIPALLYPKGMGMGDVKLALLLGVGVGWAVPVALMAGMFAALAASTVLFVRHGAAARKRAIPFAPFLALGGLVGLFAGDTVVHWYLGFLH